VRSSRLRGRVQVVGILLAVTACGTGTGPAERPSGSSRPRVGGNQIVNGLIDTAGDPWVQIVAQVGNKRCTAELIGRRTALTAAHCVTLSTQADYCYYPCGDTTACFASCIHATVVPYPAFSGFGDFDNDIAVLKLASDATTATGVVPRRIGGAPVGGAAMHLVGFGCTVWDENAPTLLQRRHGANYISDIGSQLIDYEGDTGAYGCFGDSGGPAYNFGTDCQIGVMVGRYDFPLPQFPFIDSDYEITRLDTKLAWVQSVAADPSVLACGQTVCGDGFCQAPETGCSCPQDCGTCEPPPPPAEGACACDWSCGTATAENGGGIGCLNGGSGGITSDTCGTGFSASATGSCTFDGVSCNASCPCKCEPSTGPSTGAPLYAPPNFDGDGKSDFAVWRPYEGLGYVIDSSTGAGRRNGWGLPDHIPVFADYDGDGKTDFASWNPIEGNWYFILSSTGAQPVVYWGAPGDIPVPGRYDADGKADVAVWRPSSGIWYVRKSMGGGIVRQWGLPGDIPVPGDYDGDGITNFAIWRPADGTWWVLDNSPAGYRVQQWGEAGDIPVPGDYDGDMKTDFAIWRPGTGTWWVIYSSTGAVRVQQWGQSGDVPVPGDYDGDHKTDFAVWRPSEGNWYVIDSSTGATRVRQWGLPGDIPQ